MQTRLCKLHYYRWLIFFVVASGTFMSTLTSSIVNVALPDIIESLHTNLSTAQWVVSAYLLIITSLLPLAGRLGDIYGRRPVYGFGFVGFISGSVLCGFASSIEILIAARLIKAIGAAAIMANAPAIVTSAFPQNERGRVLGMIGTVVALGTLTGPSLGGLLVEKLNWHWVFWVNIPIGLIGIAGVKFVLPVDVGRREERVDYIGATIFTIGMGSFLLVLSHGMEWGWNTLAVQGLIVAAIAAFWLFNKYEKSIVHPMLDLTIFRNWPFLAGNLSGTLSFMALFANTILLPFFLHEVIMLPPTRIGLVMSAFPIVMAIVAPFSGTLSDRIGSQVLTTAGLALMALGLFYVANLQADATLGSIIAGQAVMGFGNGLFQSPNNNSVMSSVHPSKLGVAGGINALARNFGMVSGTAIAVSIFEYRRSANVDGLFVAESDTLTASFMAGYHDALIVAACMAILGAIISFNRKGHAVSQNSP